MGVLLNVPYIVHIVLHDSFTLDTLKRMFWMNGHENLDSNVTGIVGDGTKRTYSVTYHEWVNVIGE